MKEQRRKEQQWETVADFELRWLKMRQRHEDERRALELRQQTELTQHERDKMLALARLWKKQGRALGPGMRRVLEGGKGGFRGTPG